MTVQSLRDLYDGHQGKVSDKWAIYLDVYESLFTPYRELPVRMLEIGIQNGGSLEIWSKYFRNAVALVGCDINPTCGSLQFGDPRINVVVGDANSTSTERAITSIAPQFDIIIDDGSHTSRDIISSFARYFGKLRDGGVYIAEDLHCSYWREFGGGLFDPASSINFFKRLVDVTNHESWGVPGLRSEILRTAASAYGLAFDESELARVHSVEFVSSMCIIRKRAEAANVLGARRIIGMVEAVVQLDPNAVLDTGRFPSQIDNRWSNLRQLPEEETEMLKARLKQEQERAELAETTAAQLVTAHSAEMNEFRAEHRRCAEVLRHTEQALEISDQQLKATRETLSWRLTRPLRAVRKLLK
jgi:hypothetical protein